MHVKSCFFCDTECTFTRNLSLNLHCVISVSLIIITTLGFLPTIFLLGENTKRIFHLHCSSAGDECSYEQVTQSKELLSFAFIHKSLEENQLKGEEKAAEAMDS